MSEIETNMLFRVDKVEKLPHLPFLKRKLKATLGDNSD